MLTNDRSWIVLLNGVSGEIQVENSFFNLGIALPSVLSGNWWGDSNPSKSNSKDRPINIRYRPNLIWLTLVRGEPDKR
jgi:hypothetical protein